MKCIIQIDETGNTVNHPITIDNFLFAFPDTDISGDNAPEGFAWFTRKEKYSVLGETQISENQKIELTYSKISDSNEFEDNFIVRDLTIDEINEKINDLKNNPPEDIISWTLETDTYFWLPPKPRPKGVYRWDETSSSWLECADGEKAMAAKIPSYLTPESALPKPKFSLLDLITSNTA
jgi:hypothetical protein